ncbi:MAG: GNAT family N-acetyltransferase [Candidatus Omnitrophica bacterium]|nr:GNAT family N-acetyltransferase [Candidatus Omnitrophota bacterium]
MIRRFPDNIVKPTVLVETDKFLVKLAENHEEIEEVQRLRYEVFNIEQGRGLEQAEKYGIDFDEYDEYCLHLMVIKKNPHAVIGTYRAHLGCIANSAKGFYSSREYNIKGLYSIADKCLELGRSCVSPEYRTGSAVALLWGAITELLKRARLTYMLGCVSLDETNPKIGWALYDYLVERCPPYSGATAYPRPGFRLERPPKKEIQKVLSDEKKLKRHIPPIFKGYLRLGASICGEPALDREFGTIDFFILVDIRNVPERYIRHFKYKNGMGA